MAGADTQKSGVTLVVEGFDQFVLQLNKANEALASFNERLAQSAKTGGTQVAQSLGQINQQFLGLAQTTSGVEQNWVRVNGAMVDLNDTTGQTAATLQALSGTTPQVAAATDQLGAASGAATEQVTGLGLSVADLQKNWGLYSSMPQPDLKPKQWEELTAQLNKINTSAPDASREMTNLIDTFVKANAPIQQVAKSQRELYEETRLVRQGMTLVGAAMAGLGVIGKKLALDTAMQASRIEELEILLEVTRRNAQDVATAEGDMAAAQELSTEAVKKQVEGIRALHLTGVVANQTVANLIRYNLDWTRATDLARIAQDAATFAAQDSSKAITGLINGITTLQPRVLRTYGIMVNLEVAYEKYAQANNVAVEAMTVTERQQAALNEVLRQAPSIAGAYEAAMGTASKQVRSFQTDTINLREAYGESLVPALDLGVGSLRKVMFALTEIDPAWRGFISGAGSAGSAMMTVLGTALVLIPRLEGIKLALLQVTGATKLLSATMFAQLIPALIMVAGIGVAVAISAAEKAHREEAASILESSENYRDYINAIDEARVNNYALSESLYEIAKGADAAKEGVDALALTEAWRQLEGLLSVGGTGLAGLDQLMQAMFGQGVDFNWLIDNMDRMTESMTKAQLVVMQDAEAMRVLGIRVGLTGDELERFIILMTGGAKEAEIFRRENEASNAVELTRIRTWQLSQGVMKAGTSIMGGMAEAGNSITASMSMMPGAIRAVNGAFEDFAGQLENYVSPEVRRLSNEFNSLMKEAGRGAALRHTAQDWLDIVKQAEEDVEEARDKAREDDAEAEAKHKQDLIDLELDYANNRRDILQEFAIDRRELEEELAEELADIDAKLVEERSKLDDELADLDRKYAQDREDAARKLAQDLEDLDRKLAQDLLDAKRDLDADLQELEKDHQQKLLDIAADYAERKAGIEDKYRQLAADIEAKYAGEEEEDFDTRRKRLQARLKELLDETAGMFAHSAGVMSGTEWADVAAIQAELDALKAQELAALEERKAKELTELEKWLAEQQAKEEEAYAKAKEKRQVNYEERLAELQYQHQREEEERQRAYQRQLENLLYEYQREREERIREYQQRLAELQAQHLAEEAKARESYQRKLADLQQNLADRLAKEKQSYEDRKKELGVALEREKATIKANLDKETQDIKDAADKQLKLIVDAWKLIDSGVGMALDNMLTNTVRPKLKGIADEIIAQFNAVQRAVDKMGMLGHSPAPWWTKMGESWAAGLKAGFNSDAITANIQSALDASQWTLPNYPAMQRAALPLGAGGTTNNTRNNNLSVTAQYSQYQSKSSLMQDLKGWNMMMRYGGR